MKIYSINHGDTIGVKKEYLEKFKEDIADSRFYEPEQLNELIYDVYNKVEEIGFRIPKNELLKRLALISDHISFGEIMELKAFEFAQLLNNRFDLNTLNHYDFVASDYEN